MLNPPVPPSAEAAAGWTPKDGAIAGGAPNAEAAPKLGGAAPNVTGAAPNCGWPDPNAPEDPPPNGWAPAGGWLKLPNWGAAACCCPKANCGCCCCPPNANMPCCCCGSGAAAPKLGAAPNGLAAAGAWCCVGAVWNAAVAGKEEGAPNANTGPPAAGCGALGPLPNPNIGVDAACTTGAGPAKNGCAVLVAGAGAPNMGALLVVTVCAANDMPKPVGFSTGDDAAACGLGAVVTAGMKNAGAVKEGCAGELGVCGAGLPNANREFVTGDGEEPKMVLAEGANTDAVGAGAGFVGLLRVGVAKEGVALPAPKAKETFEAAEDGVGGLPKPPNALPPNGCEAGADAGVGRAADDVKPNRLGEVEGEGAAEPNAVGVVEPPNAKSEGAAAAVVGEAPNRGACCVLAAVWDPEAAAPNKKLEVGAVVAAADRDERVLAAALLVTPKIGEGSGEDERLLGEG